LQSPQRTGVSEIIFRDQVTKYIAQPWYEALQLWSCNFQRSNNVAPKTSGLFGQQDDITVLSVTRATGLNPALA
jgi:hypothetical protein